MRNFNVSYDNDELDISTDWFDMTLDDNTEDIGDLSIEVRSNNIGGHFKIVFSHEMKNEEIVGIKYRIYKTNSYTN